MRYPTCLAVILVLGLAASARAEAPAQAGMINPLPLVPGGQDLAGLLQFGGAVRTDLVFAASTPILSEASIWLEYGLSDTNRLRLSLAGTGMLPTGENQTTLLPKLGLEIALGTEGRLATFVAGLQAGFALTDLDQEETSADLCLSPYLGGVFTLPTGATSRLLLAPMFGLLYVRGDGNATRRWSSVAPYLTPQATLTLGWELSLGELGTLRPQLTGLIRGIVEQGDLAGVLLSASAGLAVVF